MARAKEFDVNDVLHKAMLLFWERGYERTSMKELVSFMGVHKGSMYDTFGDKRSLFLKSLEHYININKELLVNGAESSGSSKEAIRFLFELAIQKQENFPNGCFVVNTAIELAKFDPVARDWVHRNYAIIEQLIYELIFAGQQSGELSELLNAEELSNFLMNSLIGLQVMANTMDSEKLRKTLEMNLFLLK